MIPDYYQQDKNIIHCRLIIQIFCRRLVVVKRAYNSLQVGYFLFYGQEQS